MRKDRLIATAAASAVAFTAAHAARAEGRSFQERRDPCPGLGTEDAAFDLGGQA